MRIETENNILIVTVEQELDHHLASRLRETIDSYIVHQKMRYLIFDFSGLTFMDSAGVGMIMGRYRLMNSMGGKIAVVCQGNRTLKMLELSGLHLIVENFQNLDEARDGMRELERQRKENK